MAESSYTRRDFLKTRVGAAAGAAILAGCSDNNDEEETTPTTPEETTETPESTPEDTPEETETPEEEASTQWTWEDILEKEQEARKQTYQIIDQSKDTWEEAVIDPTDEKYLEDPDLLLEDHPGIDGDWLDLYGEGRHGVYTFTHGGDKFDHEHFQQLDDIDDIVRDAITFYIHLVDTSTGLNSAPSGAAGTAGEFAQDLIKQTHGLDLHVFNHSNDGHGFNYHIDTENDYEVKITDTTSDRQANITERPLSDRSGQDVIARFEGEIGGGTEAITRGMSSINRHVDYDLEDGRAAVESDIMEDVMADMQDGHISEDVYWRIRPAVAVMMHRAIHEDDLENWQYVSGDSIDDLPRYNPEIDNNFDEVYQQVADMVVDTEESGEYMDAVLTDY